MPDNIVRRIVLCIIVAIIVPPACLLVWGPRWYKRLRVKAYDLTARYWHLAVPLAWWN